MIEHCIKFLEFRMHPRRAGSYSNAYYAAKRAARSYKRGGGGGNNNGGNGDGCGGCLVLLFLFCACWFISFWSLLFTDMDSDLAPIIAIPLGVILAFVLDKLATESAVSKSVPIPIEDEITRREFFQQYEFRKYNPVNHPYVLGIAIGAKTYRYTVSDIKSFWVDFDSFENKVLLHISDNTFSISKTVQNQKDIDFFINFIMQCGGLDVRGKIPTEPPSNK